MTALCAAVVKILHVSCIIKFGCSKELINLIYLWKTVQKSKPPPPKKPEENSVFSAILCFVVENNPSLPPKDPPLPKYWMGSPGIYFITRFNWRKLKSSYTKTLYKNSLISLRLSKTAGFRNTSLDRKEGAPHFHTLPSLIISSHQLVIRKPEREKF